MKKYKFDYSFIILFIIILLSPKQNLIYKLLLALVLHEIGHLLMIVIFRYKIESIKISAFGFFLKLEKGRYYFYKDFIIYLAGILVNFLLFILINDKEFKSINLFLIIINILPIYPLDGFNAIKALFSYYFPYYFVLKIGSILSLFINIILLIFSIAIKLDLIVTISLIYLLFLNIDLIIKNKLLYELFILDKRLYSYDYPIKKTKLYSNNLKHLYKYHTVEIVLGNKTIKEAEILKKYLK